MGDVNQLLKGLEGAGKALCHLVSDITPLLLRPGISQMELQIFSFCFLFL